MKKTLLVVIGVALVAIVAGIVFAHKPDNGKDMGAYKDEIESVLTNGTYTELTELRDDLGFQVLPWVQDEDDFAFAQEMHERMEEHHKEHGYGPWMGTKKGFMKGFQKGWKSCH